MLGPHKLSSTIRELEDKLNALKLEVHPKHTISLLTQAFANKTPTETGQPFFRLPERESASDFLNTQLTSDKLAFPAIFHPSIVLAQAVRQSFHDLYGETEGDLRFDTLFGSSTTLTPQNRRLLLSPLWMGTAYQRFDKTSRPFPLQPLTYVLNTATESELDLTTDEAWDPAHVENLLRGDSQEVVLALTQFWGEQLETTLMTLALSSKMPVDAPISLPNLEPKIEHFDFDDSKQFHQLFLESLDKGLKDFNNPVFHQLIPHLKALRKPINDYFNELSSLPKSIKTGSADKRHALYDVLKDVCHNMPSDFVLIRSKVGAELLGLCHLLFSIICYDTSVGCLNDALHYSPLVKDSQVDYSFLARKSYATFQRGEEFLRQANRDDFITKLMGQFLQKLSVLETKYNADWLGVEELKYHVARKNQESRNNHGSYHGEVIENEGGHDVVIDDGSFQSLCAKIRAIRDKKQPRTQFLMFVNQRHVIAIDVSWNENEKKLSIICLESTKTYVQLILISRLKIWLSENMMANKIYVCQAGLQKDLSSCAVYALAFSSLMAKLPLENLDNLSHLKQPTFNDLPEEFVPFEMDVHWFPASALGKKVFYLSQSTKQMEKALQELTDMPLKTVKKEIATRQKYFQIDPSYRRSREKNLPYSFLNYRRDSLRLKAMGMPYDDLSVQKIETMLGAKTKDQALRLLTARDHYPLRLFRYFLEQSTSEEINRCGEDSKKTALHWAYEKGALKKAKLLIENGAREDLQDKDGKTPKMLFKG